MRSFASLKKSTATNARLVREALGSNVDFHSVSGAGHTSFLVPCGLLAPPALFADEGEFDRKAFHRQMNASVLASFNEISDNKKL